MKLSVSSIIGLAITASLLIGVIQTASADGGSSDSEPGSLTHDSHSHALADEAVQAEDPSPEPHRYLSPSTVRPDSRSMRSPYFTSASHTGRRFDRQVHLFELPGTNRLLSCAGSGNDIERNRAGDFTCEAVDWATGKRVILQLPTDWFCGAGVFNEHGNLVFAGGTGHSGYPDDNGGEFAGHAGSYRLNSQTLAIDRLEDMHEPRWYNNMFRNWFDESIYSFGGLHNGTFSQRWEVLRNGSRSWDLMPWYHTNYSYDDYKVLNATHVAFTGATSTNSGMSPHILNLTTGDFVDTPGLRDVWLRNAASAIMLYPAQGKRVAVFGGGSYDPGVQAINKTDLINYSVWPERIPRFTAGPNLPASVLFVLATNLPNGQVFLTGGAREWRTGSVKWAAIYTPWTGEMTTLAPAKVARNYHSNIVTRTDGRVMTFGGNPVDNTFESLSEVFSLWYHDRPRPVINRVPERMRFGSAYTATVTLPRGTTLGRMTLDSPRATTHSASDTNYGLFRLKYRVVNRRDQLRTIRFTVPSDNSIPPGWYKLSVVTGGDVTRQGPSGLVPSKSRWVKILG